MALFLKQDFDSRSELQNKLAMELQEKARLKSKASDLPDGVSYSQYIKGTKETTSLAWVWILILIASLSIAVWLIINSMAR
jgi:hypothetical protein